MAKNLPAMKETRIQSLGQEDPLGKGMATRHYSCLRNSMDRGAWGLQSIGLQRVGLKWLSMHAHEAMKFFFPLCWVFVMEYRLRGLP